MPLKHTALEHAPEQSLEHRSAPAPPPPESSATNTLATRRATQVRIGISGWRYKGWRGVFYPDKLAQRRELEFASRQFDTIELNGSFYSLQRPQSFAAWNAETPDDFQFAIKGSRYITHMRRLREIETPLANFFAQGLLQLGPKLGPILWQFPPNFQFDPDRLEPFFSLLPRTHKAAAQLARRRGDRLDSGDAESSDNCTALHVANRQKDTPLRHAIEIRHPSFVSEAFIQLLRRHNVGLVVADTVAWPLLLDVTADFVYCRLHGSEQLYASGYDDRALDIWAHRIATWSRGAEVHDGTRASQTDAPQRKGRDIFVYFDNDMKVHAPVDARNLRDRVTRLLAA
jgi:uncharacterized protein YecE (DUF72 family)